MTRTDTIKYLSDSLTALFPTNGIRVFEWNILGETNIHILYTHHTSASECVSQILENDPAYMRFYIVPNRNGTWSIEYPTTHCCVVMQKGGPVTFRKITGKSEHEAATKLVAWFTKHQQAILTIAAESVANRRKS